MTRWLLALAGLTITGELHAQKFPPTAKPDSVTFKDFRRPTRVEELRFAKDSAARADTLAIKRAVAESGLEPDAMAIDGDTALVHGSVEHTTVDTTRAANGIVSIRSSTGFEHWTARVERRAGRWVLVSRTKN